MHISEDLSCAELVELVTEYLEGALTDEGTERFEEHVASCDGCASHIGQMRATIELTGSITEDDLPESTKQELLAAFRGWKAS